MYSKFQQYYVYIHSVIITELRSNFAAMYMLKLCISIEMEGISGIQSGF